MRSLIRDAWFIIQKPYVLVNPFFQIFCFSYYYKNMPYRTQISPRIAEKRAHITLFSETATRLRRLQFSSLPSRQSLLSSFPGIPRMGSGRENGLLPLRDGRYWSQTEQNSFLTQPARSGILLYCDLEAAAFKLQQLVSLSAPRSFRKQNDVFAFFLASAASLITCIDCRRFSRSINSAWMHAKTCFKNGICSTSFLATTVRYASTLLRSPAHRTVPGDSDTSQNRPAPEDFLLHRIPQ